MKIISHRGYWIEDTEKNKKNAFERSFTKGFGTETDVRDFNGQLVISHDIPLQDSILLEEFFQLYKSINPTLPLALNIKADGLQDKLFILLKKYDIENYYVFDMSIPDTIIYLKNGIKSFIRQSEYEMELPFYDQVDGVWLDSFESIWYSRELVVSHLDKGKEVVIVSSELHKRDYQQHWKMLKDWGVDKFSTLTICTDFPEKAQNFFNYE